MKLICCLFPAGAMAAAMLAGCVSAKVDYSLAGVRAVPNARFSKMAVTMKIIDRRYADKMSVASYAHKEGAYNDGIEFPMGLSDAGAVFGSGTGFAGVRWYTAPDRLYWVPSGPIADTGRRIGEHLVKAGIFMAVDVAPPGTQPSAADLVRGARLVVTVNRLLALKERRPGLDTFGFLGISALGSSREILSIDAEWILSDSTGKELSRGRLSKSINGEGSCFQAKNKPFAIIEDGAKQLGEAIAASLR